MSTHLSSLSAGLLHRVMWLFFTGGVRDTQQWTSKPKFAAARVCCHLTEPQRDATSGSLMSAALGSLGAAPQSCAPTSLLQLAFASTRCLLLAGQMQALGSAYLLPHLQHLNGGPLCQSTPEVRRQPLLHWVALQLLQECHSVSHREHAPTAGKGLAQFGVNYSWGTSNALDGWKASMHLHCEGHQLEPHSAARHKSGSARTAASCCPHSEQPCSPWHEDTPERGSQSGLQDAAAGGQLLCCLNSSCCHAAA